MDKKTNPTFQGKTIFLRPIVEDAPFMLESIQDEEGNRLTDSQQTFTLEQIEAWCESLATKEGRVDCAIVSKETGEYLGEVVLNQLDQINRSANFRITLRGSTALMSYNSTVLI
jgi:hypothetical protein